jgi:RimJ/RimL family protein N-acetyltransferase
MIAAELDGHERLAEVLGVRVPADWPPEHHDNATLTFWSDQLSRPEAAGWWLHYAVLHQSPVGPALVGSVGYKGPPKGGVVEIGYSIVPSYQRQGLATEACQALIESAWSRGADVIIAHTLEGLEPSLGVLRKLGFRPSQSPEPGVLAFALEAEAS